MLKRLKSENSISLSFPLKSLAVMMLTAGLTRLAQKITGAKNKRFTGLKKHFKSPLKVCFLDHETYFNTAEKGLAC